MTISPPDRLWKLILLLGFSWIQNELFEAQEQILDNIWKSNGPCHWGVSGC